MADHVQGREEKILEDAGCPQGSTFIVQDLFYNMTGQTHFENPKAWESFLNWFMSQMNSDGEVVYGDYTWFLPLSDAIPFVLLLSLLYAWFIYRKTKKQTAE